MYENKTNINTSIYGDKDPEFLRKILIVNLFGMIGVLFTFTFGLLSYGENNPLSYILFLSAGILSLNYFLFIKKTKYALGSHVIVYLFLVLLLYLVYSGGVENTGTLWIYAFPGLALFLHGFKHGLIDVFIFICLISLMFLLNNDVFLHATYTGAFKLRLILSFLMVAFLSGLHEYSSAKSFEEMRSLTQKLINVAKQDQLTELADKRDVHEKMEALYEYARKHDEPLSIMLCDIDYLHDINGRYGQAVGDMVIKEVSKEIQNSIQNTHTLARWSGEEFLIVLPNIKINDAYNFAEALAKRIKNLKIMHDRNRIQVSLTMGISDTKSANSIYAAIRQADNRMYT